MVNVPFRGGGEAVTALLNGSTPLLFSGGSFFPQLIENGSAVGLVVDSPARAPLFPQVPTLLELGFTEKLNRNYLGLVVPAATPRAIIERVARDVVAIMADPAFRQASLIDRGLEPIGDAPAAFARFIDEDRAAFAAVTREAGIERQ
jgi:tripartite-type tricarboxylate transporter receptor subunit TctC